MSGAILFQSQSTPLLTKFSAAAKPSRMPAQAAEKPAPILPHSSEKNAEIGSQFE